MSRMNSRNRKKFYKLLKERDGEQCNICRKKGGFETLVIDHIDNNNSNNDPENLQLLCPSDNTKKNPRGKGKKRSPVSIDTNAHEAEKIVSAEFRKNQESEPRFRHWLYDKIKVLGKMKFDEVVDAGAEKAGCSQATIIRYIKKVVSSEGIYEVNVDLENNKIIEFKPTYKEKIMHTVQLLASNDKKIVEAHGSFPEV